MDWDKLRGRTCLGLGRGSGGKKAALHCAGRVHVKTERWASGEISWPELSTITVTHRQAQGAIQARLQAPGSSMMQCLSASAVLCTESRGAHTFAAEQDYVNYMRTKCHNPRHTGHFNNA